MSGEEGIRCWYAVIFVDGRSRVSSLDFSTRQMTQPDACSVFHEEGIEGVRFGSRGRVYASTPLELAHVDVSHAADWDLFVPRLRSLLRRGH